MAGSYMHCVDGDGLFVGTDLIDNLGDAHEALEEMFGMIQVLARGDLELIEQARIHYADGLRGTVHPDAQWDRSVDYGGTP